MLVEISSSAFGHQVLDYEQIIYNTERLKTKVFPIMYESKTSANDFMLDHIKSQHFVLPHFPAWMVHRALLRLSGKYNKLAHELNSTNCKFLPQIHALPPCPAAESMRQLFVSSKTSLTREIYPNLIVGLVLRDSGYEKSMLVDVEKHASRHRNAKVENFIPTLHFLRDQSCQILRFGRHLLPNLEVEKLTTSVGVVQSDLGGDALDFQLADLCDFFISTSSGPDVLAMFFRKPLFLIDATFPVIPRTQIVKSILVKDYFRIESQRHYKMNFDELKSLHENHVEASTLLRKGIVYTQSKSPNDILHFVKSRVFGLNIPDRFEYKEVEPNLFY